MNSEKIEILKLLIPDIPEVLEIQTEAKLSFWNEQAYKDEIDRLDTLSYVAKLNEKVIGFIISRRITSLDINELVEIEIYNIGIKYEKRHLGIGSQLLEKIIKNSDIKSGSIWLEVRKSNEIAIKFYEKQGFVKMDERKDFFSNPIENALIMKCDI